MPSGKNKAALTKHIRRNNIAPAAGAVFFLILSLTSGSLRAQTSPDLIRTQYMNWTGLKIKYKEGDWSGSVEIQNRIFLGPFREDALLLPRLILLRKISSRFSAGAGMAYFLHSSPSVPDEKVEFWNSEFRPQIELNYKLRIHSLEIASRLRVEERFIQIQGTNPDRSQYKRTERWRIRIRLKMPLNQKIHFIVSDEFFAKRSRGILIDAEENRLRTGLGLSLTEGNELAAEYMHVYRNFGNEHPLQRHTLVLSYSLLLSPKRMQAKN